MRTGAKLYILNFLQKLTLFHSYWRGVEVWREVESTPSVVVCFKQVIFGGGMKYLRNDKGQMRDSGFGNVNEWMGNYLSQAMQTHFRNNWKCSKDIMGFLTRMSERAKVLLLLLNSPSVHCEKVDGGSWC